MKKGILLAAAFCVWMALPAQAQQNTPENTSENTLTPPSASAAAPMPAPVPPPQKKYPYEKLLHPVLKKFIDEGGTLSYIGNENGLNGWVLEKGENVQISYTTADGKGIIRGMLFGVSEDDFITQKQLVRFRDLGEDRVLEAFPPLTAATSPPSSAGVASGVQRAERLYAEVEKTRWFSFGTARGRPVYIFVDPSCESCHKYWKDLKPQADAGVLQLRLIPIGWTKEARAQAAALLAAPKPAELWAALAEGKKEALAAIEVTETGRASARQNEDTMSKWRLTTAPFTVYRNTQGRIILIRDRPENLMLVISDLTL